MFKLFPILFEFPKVMITAIIETLFPQTYKKIQNGHIKRNKNQNSKS